ncbi:MAG: aminotransferase class V-fold PLP-dependent enzyme [Actinobacteria bacterium]|nr:aminotransferase class V-fold PLP-dependent enzyme [Actinomycetota bacterium]
MTLTDRLLNGSSEQPGLLQIKGVDIYGYPMVTNNREAVFAMNLEGLPAKQVVKRCISAGIIVHDRQSDAYTRHTLEAMRLDQCVRVSLAHYNTVEEVDTFLKLTNKLSQEINSKR